MDYKKVLHLHFTQGLSGRSIAEVPAASDLVRTHKRSYTPKRTTR